MQHTVATLFLSSAVFITTHAFAGTVIADAEKIPEFAAIDADGDGYITPAEAEMVPELRRIFASVDNDRDGQLDTSEWSNAVARLRGLG